MTCECLVCTIFDQRVCLPVSAIQGILPLHCTLPVPCSERWVRGLGLQDNRVFTVVCPVPKCLAGDVPIQDAKMLLSRPDRERSGSSSDWALQITQVLGMASIDVDMSKHQGDAEWLCPGDWFRPAKTRVGDDIVWLDPEAVNCALMRLGGGR